MFDHEDRLGSLHQNVSLVGKVQAIHRNIALFQHESVDGSGYPDGRMGDGIPVETLQQHFQENTLG